MRKTGVFILLLCYLAFSTGVIINSHYCMNRLASTQLFASESENCGICGMHIDDSHGCCRDEVKMVKMEDDQKVTAGVSFNLEMLALPVQVPSEFIATSFFNIPLQGHTPDQPPPGCSAYN